MILVLGVTGVFVAAGLKFDKTSAIRRTGMNLSLTVQPDASLIVEGQRLMRVKGCYDCHGTDLSGVTFINDPKIGVFSGTNLTSGEGGVGRAFLTSDYVRAIRFGVGAEGQYLRFMPSSEYSSLTDEDLARIIAAIQHAPPVNKPTVPIQVGPVAKILYLAGKMPLLFPGEFVPADLKTISKLEPSATAEYGRYLAASCTGCHNPTYSGGQIPGVPPEWPKAANLTPKGNLAHWDLEKFKATMRTGKTPEGKVLNPQYMPWPSAAAMTETEITALYEFLKQLPPGDPI